MSIKGQYVVHSSAESWREVETAKRRIRHADKSVGSFSNVGMGTAGAGVPSEDAELVESINAREVKSRQRTT